jgi:hypothetical protein
MRDRSLDAGCPFEFASLAGPGVFGWFHATDRVPKPDRQVAAIEAEFITAAARERNRTGGGLPAAARSFYKRGCSVVFCQHQ